MFKKSTLIISAIVIFILGAGSGYAIGIQKPKHLVVEGVTNIENPVDAADFSVFWEAWKNIDDLYLKNSEVTPQDKVYGAINGLVRSLGDPYSQFFNPADNKRFQEDIQGNFSGIGAEIGMRKDVLTVVAPLKGMPAEKAGLKAGDSILAINGSSTQDIGIDEGVSQIRGPENTTVTLTIFREGWDNPKDFKITRARIEAPTLDFEMKGNIAYIQLYSFNANAERLFGDAINKAAKANAQGIVLDLRNNPGGFLDVAVDLAGWFVKKGEIVVKEESRAGIDEEFKASGNEALKDIPTVVLINQGSASAAEILAGALRDIRGIKLIGEKSFGKGTVQQLKNLANGASMKITIAHWVLPKGQILEKGGLDPDFKVELKDADIEANKDPQLDKALEILKSQLK